MDNIEKALASPLGPPPRKARLRRGVRNLRRAYRSVIALVVLVLGGWAVFDAMRLHELAYDTVATTGTITKKSTAPKSAHRVTGGHLDYRLEYEFTGEDGAPVTDIASVTPEVYAAAWEGQRCTVVYLPGRASVEHWLFDNSAARIYPLWMMISRATAVFIALVVLWLSERPLRREAHLARQGEVATGQILATGKGRRRRARPWITYSFRTSGGALLEGKCAMPRTTPPAALTPGTPIEVLYDPRQPTQNKARLGFEFVELVA